MANQYPPSPPQPNPFVDPDPSSSLPAQPSPGPTARRHRDQGPSTTTTAAPTQRYTLTDAGSSTPTLLTHQPMRSDYSLPLTDKAYPDDGRYGTADADDDDTVPLNDDYGGGGLYRPDGQE